MYIRASFVPWRRFVVHGSHVVTHDLNMFSLLYGHFPLRLPFPVCIPGLVALL